MKEEEAQRHSLLPPLLLIIIRFSIKSMIRASFL